VLHCLAFGQPRQDDLLAFLDQVQDGMSSAELAGYRSAFVPIERGYLRFWCGWHPAGLLSDWNRCGFRVFVDLLLTWILERKKAAQRAACNILISLIFLVAGTGFEPVTFRL
jgi:hypothetical protein